LTPRVDVSYSGETQGALWDSPLVTIQARTLVNGQLTLTPASDRWSAELWVTNAGDKHYVSASRTMRRCITQRRRVSTVCVRSSISSADRVPGVAVWPQPPPDCGASRAADRSATGEPVADRRGQLSWALFEFSRSPYLSLVYIYVFATYFTNTVIGDPVQGQELWSLANTIVGVCVAVLAPLTGAISDRMGRRKPWIVAIALIMGASCCALWWAMPGAQGGLPVGVILTLIVVLAAVHAARPSRTRCCRRS
jgi:hypothetical protein